MLLALGGPVVTCTCIAPLSNSRTADAERVTCHDEPSEHPAMNALRGAGPDSARVVIPGAERCGPQIAPTGNLAVLLGVPNPPVFVFDATDETIQADPNWLHGRQAQCIGQGAKGAATDFMGGFIFANEIVAAEESVSTGTLAPLKSLFSFGSATDAASAATDYVAGSYGTQMTIRGILRNNGIMVFSANSVAKKARLFGKILTALAAVSSVESGISDYSACMAF